MKKQLVLQLAKKAKRATFAGKMQRAHFEQLVLRMFGALDVSTLALGDATGRRLLSPDEAVLLINESAAALSFQIHVGAEPLRQPEKPGSSRRDGPAAAAEFPGAQHATLVPVFQLSDGQGVFFVEAGLHPVLFNTTNILKHRRSLQQVGSVREDMPFYFQEVRSEFFESVYLYTHGLLSFTLEANENLAANLARFCRDPEAFAPVSAGDSREDCVPLEELLQAFKELEGLEELPLEEIQSVVGVYNLKPLLFKYAHDDYKSGVIGLRELA